MWTAGTYPGTWHTGTGVRRKDVIGACQGVLPSGWTHMMRFDSVDSFLGIEWSTGINYVMGHFITAADGTQQFITGLAATEQQWNTCYANIGATIAPIPGKGTGSSTFTPFTGRYDTPITDNIDWRIAAAIAIITLTGIYALYLSRK